MKHLRIPVAFIAIGVALWAMTSVLGKDDSPTEPMPSMEMAETQIDGYAGFTPIEAKDGALSWELFAAVEEIERQEPDPDNPGYPRYLIEPGFTKDMRALDGQQVKLMGYMFPLEPNEKQGMFLFGPYPPTCGFHYHVNANQVVEVHAEKPITFTWKPMMLEGKLHLVEKDEYSVFYRLKQARLKKTLAEKAY